MKQRAGRVKTPLTTGVTPPAGKGPMIASVIDVKDAQRCFIDIKDFDLCADHLWAIVIALPSTCIGENVSGPAVIDGRPTVAG